MVDTPSYRNLYLGTCCLIFLFFALQLAGLGNVMFLDTDPLWHVAAGDWIREHRSIPLQDPWSFTAGDYPWLNISWAWDTLASFLHEHLGWHGAVALNALTLALTLTFVFAACLDRSGSMLVALVTCFAIITTLTITLRPFQVTNLMVAAWMLILSAVMRGECRAVWLSLLPILMLAWVNMHGGFIAGPIILAAFFLQTLREGDKLLSHQLLAIGLVSLLAIFANPYGFSIIEAVWRPLTTVANQFIIEWQPVEFSLAGLKTHIYAALFILLVVGRKLPVLPAERWLAYFWLLMSLHSVRHMPIFAIISAPIFACALQRLLMHAPAFATLHERVRQATIEKDIDYPLPAIGMAVCLLVAAWLPSPMAARHFNQEDMAVPALGEELAYLKKRYPQAHVLNHFNLGGYMLYETRGKVPAFVDARADTAYPPAVMKDYVAFLKAEPGWEEALDRYKITIVMLPNDFDTHLIERFAKHKAWVQVFKGPRATIFARRSGKKAS